MKESDFENMELVGPNRVHDKTTGKQYIVDLEKRRYKIINNNGIDFGDWIDMETV